MFHHLSIPPFVNNGSLSAPAKKPFALSSRGHSKFTIGASPILHNQFSIGFYDHYPIRGENHIDSIDSNFQSKDLLMVNC
jgi:hypothetical protein